MHKEKEENGILSHLHHHEAYIRNRELDALEHGLLDGDMFLQVSEYKYCVCWSKYIIICTEKGQLNAFISFGYNKF